MKTWCIMYILFPYVTPICVNAQFSIPPSCNCTNGLTFCMCTVSQSNWLMQILQYIFSDILCLIHIQYIYIYHERLGWQQLFIVYSSNPYVINLLYINCFSVQWDMKISPVAVSYFPVIIDNNYAVHTYYYKHLHFTCAF